MNTRHNKGFQPKLPAKSQINMVRDRFKSIIETWRTKKIKIMYAYLNALTYRACKNMGVLKQVRRAQGNRKGFHKIVGDIKAIALNGIKKFNITIQGMVEQLEVFWGLTISEASLRKYRYELQDTFELFYFYSRPFPEGNKGDSTNRLPPALKDFDLVTACILLEVLEDVLVKNRECHLTDFPGNAAMCRLIYNALFQHMQYHNESGIEEDAVPCYRRNKCVDDPIVMIVEGDRVRASQMDWAAELTEEGATNWGLTLIPDEYGVVPDLF